MKTALDPRHKRRQKMVEELFMTDFHKQRISADTKEIIKNLSLIDKGIEKAASEFPIDKINKVDLSIDRKSTRLNSSH